MWGRRAVQRAGGYAGFDHGVEVGAGFGIAQAVEERFFGEPAIVDDAVGHALVIIREEFGHLLFRRPGDVVPEHVGFVAVDQFAQLCGGVGGVVALGGHASEHVAEIGDRFRPCRPIEAAGVVEAEAHAAGADSRRQLTYEVALCVPAGTPGVGNVRGPQAVSVVVLGHEDDVAGAGCFEEVGPGVCVKGAGGFVEGGAERRVRTIAVGCFVVRFRRAARQAHRVLVPLRIGRVLVHVVVVVVHQLVDRTAARRKGRDREDAPMDEDAEPGFIEPSGAGAGGEGVEGGHRCFSGGCRGA